MPFPRPCPLALALLACLPLPALAHDPTQLDAVVVTASPLAGDAESLARPIEVLQGEGLDRAKAATLGETVARLPGVQSSYFGPGVGRPILRGLDGPRVQVLSSGIGAMDASTVSADHAASVEPFLADQIEVLKGPATLLFGSGAIGGAVNVVDGRIARQLPAADFGGRAELRGNSGSHERSGMFRLDGVSGGNLVLHADALVRDTDDYRIPGQASLDADGDPQRGRLANSALRTRAGGLGLSWLGEAGQLGLAASTWRSNYGIPLGAHVHHGDAHDHGQEDADHDHDHDHGHEGEAHGGEGRVRVDMVQNRLELKAGLYTPLPALERVDLDAGYSDYEHVELEDGVAGTRYTSRGYEARLEAVQAELGGWRGAFGLQLGQVDFHAEGAEAFVPPTSTDSWGLFVLQEKKAGPLTLELGARHDQVRLEPRGTRPARRFDANSLSASAIWDVSPALDLRLGLDRSERAPSQEELYAGGMHVATGSIEIGDAGLETERALRAELGLHAHGERYDFRAAVYQSRFDDFIYLAETGIEEDETPVRLWTQADARFTGAEAELVLHLAEDRAGTWDLRLFGDRVNARLDGQGQRQVQFAVPHGDHVHAYQASLANGGHLPRIAPARLGASLDWSSGGWRAALGAVRYQAQERVAEHEDPSPGYTLVDAHLAYAWQRGAGPQWELFLDGSNLGDRQARPHTSLLRRHAPLPGRALAFGIRAWF